MEAVRRALFDRVNAIAERNPGLNSDDILEDAIRAAAEVIVLSPADIAPVTGDPEDAAILATANVGRADYLVTGDGGLLALSRHERTSIVTPRRFFELLEADPV